MHDYLVAIRLRTGLLEEDLLLLLELVTPKAGLEAFADVHAEEDRGGEPLRDDVQDVEHRLGHGAVEGSWGHGEKRVGLKAHDDDAVDGDDVLERDRMRIADESDTG